MTEVDEYGHYHRSPGCDRPVGSHGHQCITASDVARLNESGWQVTPMPEPECKTCGDTGSFEVDGIDYPCRSCGEHDFFEAYEVALTNIRTYHSLSRTRHSDKGFVCCGLCQTLWPCETFVNANDALGCDHAPKPGSGICEHCGQTVDRG